MICYCPLSNVRVWKDPSHINVFNISFFLVYHFQVGLLNKPTDMKIKASNLVKVNVFKDQVCLNDILFNYSLFMTFLW